MSYYEIITCRLAIRVCIGYGPTGRKKHRTFSMKGINPNASWEGIMEVIRALAPLLEFPIVDIQKVTSRKIIFYEDAALSVPLEQVDAVEKKALMGSAQNFKIIPFPVTFRQSAANCQSADLLNGTAKNAKILPFPSVAARLSSSQASFSSTRAPPQAWAV